MSAREIIIQAEQSGVRLWLESGGVRFSGRPSRSMLTLLRQHKPAIIEALARPEPASPAPKPTQAPLRRPAATVARPADVYEVRTHPGARWFTCIEQDDRVTGHRATLAELRAEFRRKWPACEIRVKEAAR